MIVSLLLLMMVVVVVVVMSIWIRNMPYMCLVLIFPTIRWRLWIIMMAILILILMMRRICRQWWWEWSTPPPPLSYTDSHIWEMYRPTQNVSIDPPFIYPPTRTAIIRDGWSNTIHTHTTLDATGPMVDRSWTFIKTRSLSLSVTPVFFFYSFHVWCICCISWYIAIIYIHKLLILSDLFWRDTQGSLGVVTFPGYR